MNFLVSSFIFLIGLYATTALPRYLIIPLDEVRLIESSPRFSLEPSLVRVSRDVEPFLPVALATVHSDDEETIPKIERTAAHILDYADFGGHTGENGAFGWFADFPAQR